MIKYEYSKSTALTDLRTSQGDEFTPNKILHTI